MSVRPIHHTFGPHVTRRYALATDALLLRPWNWKKTEHREALTRGIGEYFGGSAHLFASGREGLLALLRSLRFEHGAEIIIQGYTCVALPNAIHAAGYTPVYVDIAKETLNMDPAALAGRLSNRTRAVICQHTFGLPADTAALRALCDARKLVFIEDCAHVLPDAKGPAEIAARAHHLMLSFGRDKALSGIAGGAIVSRDAAVSAALSEEEEQATELSAGSVARLLAYPPLYHKANMVYGLFGAGKALLKSAQCTGVLPPVITLQEKRGRMPASIRRMPEPCAALALAGWHDLLNINDRRRALTAAYLEAARSRGWAVPGSVHAGLPLQKFPLFTARAEDVRRELKGRNIHLDDGWTGAVVCPRSVEQEATNYIAGSCPHAEHVARCILTLPTHPTMRDAQLQALLAALPALPA